MSEALFCDPVTGVCEIPGAREQQQAMKEQTATGDKPLKVIYFTDPICSTCWGIEPQWRKLKLEYGHLLDIHYHMGGLLPSWDVYNSGGISGPADVAHHWEEVSHHYQMPIDGGVWLEDPLHSSYPPSIWFKAAQHQDEKKAVILLRRLREMVFMEKLNITRPEHIHAAAAYAQLNIEQLDHDFDTVAATLFEQDLQLGRQMGVRGFPSVFMINREGDKELVYGAKPYPVFITALQKLLPVAQPRNYAKGIDLFSYFPTLTAKEYAVLNEVTYEQAASELETHREQHGLTLYHTRAGDLWKR